MPSSNEEFQHAIADPLESLNRPERATEVSKFPHSRLFSYHSKNLGLQLGWVLFLYALLSVISRTMFFFLSQKGKRGKGEKGYVFAMFFFCPLCSKGNF